MSKDQAGKNALPPLNNQKSREESWLGFLWHLSVQKKKKQHDWKGYKLFECVGKKEEEDSDYTKPHPGCMIKKSRLQCWNCVVSNILQDLFLFVSIQNEISAAWMWIFLN